MVRPRREFVLPTAERLAQSCTVIGFQFVGDNVNLNAYVLPVMYAFENEETSIDRVDYENDGSAVKNARGYCCYYNFSKVRIRVYHWNDANEIDG